MGISKFNMKSLKRDIKNTLVYGFSLGISFMLTLITFNLAYLNKENRVESIELATVIFTILFITFYLGLYMNKFFISKKKKEVSVLLISGASTTDVAGGFLKQNITLGIFALVIGVLGLLIATPLISFLLGMYIKGDIFKLNLEGTLIAFIVIFMELFCISLSNMGISYRNEVCELIQGINNTVTKKKRGVAIQYLSLISPIMCIMPLTLVLFTKNGDLLAVSILSLVFFIIGLIGVVMFTTEYIPNLIEKKLQKINKDSKINVIALRNLKNSLEGSKGIMLCYLLTFLAFISSTMSEVEIKKVIIKTAIIVAISCILLIIVFIYKFHVDASNRISYFNNMNLLGYEDEMIKNIIFKETIMYFLIIFIIPLIQIISTLIIYLSLGIIDLPILLIILISLLLVITLGFTVSYVIYKRVIFSNFKCIGKYE